MSPSLPPRNRLLALEQELQARRSSNTPKSKKHPPNPAHLPNDPQQAVPAIKAPAPRRKRSQATAWQRLAAQISHNHPVHLPSIAAVDRTPLHPPIPRQQPPTPAPTPVQTPAPASAPASAPTEAPEISWRDLASQLTNRSLPPAPKPQKQPEPIPTLPAPDPKPRNQPEPIPAAPLPTDPLTIPVSAVEIADDAPSQSIAPLPHPSFPFLSVRVFPPLNPSRPVAVLDSPKDAPNTQAPSASWQDLATQIRQVRSPTPPLLPPPLDTPPDLSELFDDLETDSAYPPPPPLDTSLDLSELFDDPETDPGYPQPPVLPQTPEDPSRYSFLPPFWPVDVLITFPSKRDKK